MIISFFFSFLFRVFSRSFETGPPPSIGLDEQLGKKEKQSLASSFFFLVILDRSLPDKP